MHPAPLFLGIMSGTSCDGIDVAVVRMDEHPQLLHFLSTPMPAELHEPLLRLAEPGLNEIDHMGEVGRRLGRAYARAALAAIEAAGLTPSDIAAIGCHGQTVRHRPNARHAFTLQIGSMADIAEITGITTVGDFRSRDMAAGGQGAPLVPFAHRQLFASDGQDSAVLNLGGIANITWLGRDGTVSGFDCGPGNMLMDAVMLTLSDGRNGYDSEGELAAAGRVCEQLLERLMRHPFLAKRPPKSTFREEFGADVVDAILAWPDISDAERMATAAAFTVRSIAQAAAFLPAAPARWLLCGGGAHNRHLLAELCRALAPAEVATTESAGIPPQAVEAVCFAILARHTLAGEINCLASVTGAARDVCGGTITPGANWAQLLHNIPAWTR